METKSNDPIEALQTLSYSQIYDELYKIKLNLYWMENQVSLTKEQWEMFNVIKNSVRQMLGCK